MNDFTKDELEDIANCIWVYDDLREDWAHLELLNKLRSMIDNYSECSVGEENIRELIKIQSSPGNYDCNEYMYGLANGLILALSCITGECEYLEKPKIWLDDLPKPELIAGLCINE